MSLTAIRRIVSVEAAILEYLCHQTPRSLIQEAARRVGVEASGTVCIATYFHLSLSQRIATSYCSFRDLLNNEEFVAAGSITINQRTLSGADGRQYRGRHDVITLDPELTQAIQVFSTQRRLINLALRF